MRGGFDAETLLQLERKATGQSSLHPRASRGGCDGAVWVREMPKSQRIWVELSGEIIVARIRGALTAADVTELQSQVMLLLSESGRSQVLYDALEMEPPDVDLTLAQQPNSEELRKRGVRAALLVPNTRLAYIARLAFGEGNFRVIYNDLAEAIRWLADDGRLA